MLSPEKQLLRAEHKQPAHGRAGPAVGILDSAMAGASDGARGGGGGLRLSVICLCEGEGAGYF